MSLNPSAVSQSFATALLESVGSKYSYSRKRRDGFDAWQEHIRKSAASVGSAFAPRRDRELRRAVVPG
jgi:hypothetical protein